MKYEVRRSTVFKKDLKLAKKRNMNMTEIYFVIKELANVLNGKQKNNSRFFCCRNCKITVEKCRKLWYSVIAAEPPAEGRWVQMCDIILTFLISVGASVVGCLYNMLSEHKSQSLFQQRWRIKFPISAIPAIFSVFCQFSCIREQLSTSPGYICPLFTIFVDNFAFPCSILLPQMI